MLDYRIETFLTLCRERNYSKTAKELNITQPAVTQHIQYLERLYNVKLFVYENKTLALTKQGKILEQNAKGLCASNRKITELIQQSLTTRKHLIFGATYSIAEYSLKPVLAKLLREHPEFRMTMFVGTSDELLKKIETNEIDCAFIEGKFPKEEYDHCLLSVERCIGISGRKLNSQDVASGDLINETIICREPEASSRKILDQILEDNHLTIQSFYNSLEIQNNNIIIDYVKQNLGITFLYESVVSKELEEGTLFEIPWNREVYQEFNFVILKNHMFCDDYYRFYWYAKEQYEAMYGDTTGKIKKLQ